MFGSIWPGSIKGEDTCEISANQEQELPVAAMFVVQSGQNATK